MIAATFALLAAYQLKHFLCDFPLQRPWMLRKFSADPDEWVPALAAHAGVHALGTLAIAGAFLLLARPASMLPSSAAALAAFDFVIHFTMDRIKASPGMMGRWKNLSATDFESISTIEKTFGSDPKFAPWKAKKLCGNTLFWWSLGFDQCVHHLTHYAIIAFLLLSL